MKRRNYLQCVCAFLLGRVSKLALAPKATDALGVLDLAAVVSLRKYVT